MTDRVGAQALEQAVEGKYLARRRLGRKGLFLGLLLFLLALNQGCSSDEKRRAEGPTPPPVQDVKCENVMEWIRLRPACKICKSDSDCALQRDNCCDQTAVHKRYVVECERTCGRECPQDSLIGRQISWIPRCVNGICALRNQETHPPSAQQPAPASGQ